MQNNEYISQTDVFGIVLHIEQLELKSGARVARNIEPIREWTHYHSILMKLIYSCNEGTAEDPPK